MEQENVRTIQIAEISALINNTRLTVPSHMPITLYGRDFKIRISASTGQVTTTVQRGQLTIDPKIGGKRIMLTRPSAHVAAVSLTFRRNGTASLRNPPRGEFILTVK